MDSLAQIQNRKGGCRPNGGSFFSNMRDKKTGLHEKSGIKSPKTLFVHCFRNRDRDRNGSADHRVVTHSDEPHHLDVGRNG